VTAPLASPRTPARLPVARQPIWTTGNQLHGYEYLYRSRQGRPAQVDLWSASDQDVATASVLETLYDAGEPPGDTRAFVNVTRAFLVQDRPLPAAHDRLVLEVVESVVVDDEVLAGLAGLRAVGHLIAIDDFEATAGQQRMLPYADYVKIDCRAFERQGTALVDLARSSGGRLVAERVSNADRLATCTRLGFDLLQGDVLGPAVTLPL
jgi:EAL and modified HD-GYP domain-containing signal transduction protein